MNDKLSLTELQLVIKDSLYAAMPGMYWVIAEISEIKENYAGHCYLELVEKDPTEINIKAKVRAVIWAKRYNFLKSFFESSTGESLREGFKVLIKITVEYHEIYGLSLVINDIDPTFTIGEMAIRRQKIISKLEHEGVFTMNKELSFPLLPKRIAIISSKNAAGYSDFLKHLHGNSYGYSFHTHLFEASMQGTDTEISVIKTLNRISEYTDLFDTVVIIRGGGSQTDLSWFDNYNIAYLITQFPLPVLTGIGHEKDLTVTDMVAHKSLKTPTAVADFLISTFTETEDYVLQISKSISDLSLSAIKEYNQRLDISRMKLIPVSGRLIAEAREKLSGNIIAITNLGKEYLFRKGIIPANLISRLTSATKYCFNENGKRMIIYKEDLKNQASATLKQSFSFIDSLYTNLMMLNPDNVLKRGYTVTSLNGKIIKNAGVLKEGDNIETRFNDGTVNSRVTEKG